MINYPETLNKGDVIGITAPSSGVTGVFSNKLDNAIKQINKLGFEVVETNSVRKQNKLVSSSPKTRAEEFMKLYLDNNIKAIIPPWGGEFLMDILPYLNYEKLNNSNPKWVMGFSDISTLLFVLTLKLNIATAHGPNFLDFGNDSIDSSVLRSLEILNQKKNSSFIQHSLDSYQEEWLEVKEDTFPPYNLTEEVKWKIINNKKSTKFNGRLLGGNLDVICKLIGTPYDQVNEYINKFSDEGIIWYFESCEMDSTDIHRTFWQMEQNGWFKNTNGFLYGRVDGYNDVQDYSYVDALKDLAKNIEVPIVYDVDLGHKPPQLTYINGAYAEISVDENEEKIVQKMI
ncbi:MAG: S66 peptidase family protein [Halanaerobiales bacterium]|nr:S66 peptidase family protein [Halanaerobiales bacterium]